MIAIIDYGVGNLFSLCSSIRKIGMEAVVTADPAVIEAADRVILPGVGVFGDAIRKLRATGLDQLLQKLAAEGQLMSYSHTGYWQCMDTKRDKDTLEKLWNSGKAPWKVWVD